MGAHLDHAALNNLAIHPPLTHPALTLISTLTFMVIFTLQDISLATLDVAGFAFSLSNTFCALSGSLAVGPSFSEPLSLDFAPTEYKMAPDSGSSPLAAILSFTFYLAYTRALLLSLLEPLSNLSGLDHFHHHYGPVSWYGGRG